MSIAKPSCPNCGEYQSLVVADYGDEVEPYWTCENCGYTLSAEPEPPDECPECGSEDIGEEPYGDSNEALWICLECGAKSDFTHWQKLDVVAGPGWSEQDSAPLTEPYAKAGG